VSTFRCWCGKARKPWAHWCKQHAAWAAAGQPPSSRGILTYIRCLPKRLRKQPLQVGGTTRGLGMRLFVDEAGRVDFAALDRAVTATPAEV
jgi:hypothetical protein